MELSNDFERESKDENIRRLVVSLVKEVQKPNNFDGFSGAAKNMFSSFGIEQTDKTVGERERWQEIYDGYQKWQNTEAVRAGKFIDLEMWGVGDEYSNIGLKFNKLPFGVRVVQVSPGACSMSGSPLKPKEGFYENFEHVVGIDPNTVRDRENKNIFYVVGDKYFRVPAINPIGELKKILGR